MTMERKNAETELAGWRERICRTDAERKTFDWAAAAVLEFITDEDGEGTVAEDLLHRFEEQLPGMRPDCSSDDPELADWKAQVRIARRLAGRIRIG